MAEEKKVVYGTTFTPVVLDMMRSFGVGVDIVPCECPFCANMHNKDYPYCSKECTGFDAIVKPGYGSWFKITNQKCSHIHSKCQVGECDSQRKQNFIDPEKDVIRPHYPQPFCEAHLPKCSCGNSRFTTSKLEMKYPLSAEDLALFNPLCAKCFLACPIAGCKDLRPYKRLVVDDKYEYELTPSCKTHSTPEPVKGTDVVKS
ncbi:MAG: hypothetical protein Hyperionvirus51_4 [Hyperionvirus sp.]|uniref:Uncharacterized protein n=1 Tax=Hyperionvirus sp. TaxID=2487770 RepID=A0A3G5ACL4_9VIRU|nr:MAG: hypothetical protein Hyperionvirus51_4 [Hyperionvirus sp.]